MSDSDIAIVGMAAHLPGARSTTEFWQRLRDGLESVVELSEEELLESGVPRDAIRRPGYVRSASPLQDVYDFDADFFGLSPKEAGIMDPQHRHFLMAAWEAMEDAGHVPSSFDGAIGVFAGCGVANYYMLNLLSNPDLVEDVGLFLLRHTGNDKDFLATRASYIFDLHGPSVNVQTACSTSLVATHLAVSHLLSGECDLALAGGATIEIPHRVGYQYHEGEVLSPDGHCRAFDHRSQGTVFGSGAGVVAMRRLDDALEGGDDIYAVIKGTAVNNDGSRKVGYLAPSVDGQAACITEALAVADVDPETIGYVECHGTGTPMGDPIEIAALTQAFHADGDKLGYCRIGSVKTNIGHLDTAAGVASLIKASLSLTNGEIPASLNFERPNPQLGIEDTPFVVNDTLTTWKRPDSTPRRAAVNSLGVGGTNAFAVLEEAPETGPSEPADGPQLLVLSARNKRALDGASARLAQHLRENPDTNLADVAWTLQVGREHFDERRVLAVRDVQDAVDKLTELDPRRVFTHTASHTDSRIAFMFPGGGAQYPGMAADLYTTEPEFARQLDRGLDLLSQRHDLDLRPVLLGDADERAEAQLASTIYQIPAIFIVEHALARLLMSWGIEPSAMLGHSLGENTAACIAGTISFEDCLGLVVLRGNLMAEAGGSAVVVPLPADEIADLLHDLELDLAVLNGPDLTVVSGTAERLAQLSDRLAGEGTEVQPVKIDTAPHSRLYDPLLPRFRAYLESIELHPPRIPWVSNRTGDWITDAEATDPEYWVGHLRNTVRFSDCVSTLVAEPGQLLLEVGPGKNLSSLVRMHPDVKAGHAAIPTMRHPDEVVTDDEFLLAAIGRIWAVGGPLDTERLFENQDRRRVHLPTYAFQTQPFFIEPGRGHESTSSTTYLDRDEEESRWFWEPVWRSRDLDDPASTEPLTWLVLADDAGVSDAVVDRLRDRGDDVVVARTGDSYLAVSEQEYLIAPEHGLFTYESLVRDLVRSGHIPDRIAHLSLLAPDDLHYRPGSSFFHRNQELGFQSLVFLAQAWDTAGVSAPLHISVATMGAQRVFDDDPTQWPEQATVLGPVKVIPREMADITVSTFDIAQLDLFPEGRLQVGADKVVETVHQVRSEGLGALTRRLAQSEGEPARGRLSRDQILHQMVFTELTAPPSNDVVAIRGDRRFVQDVRRATLEADQGHRLRTGGVVLITGGLGGIALATAEHLHRDRDAKLVLLSRTGLPPRETWDDQIARLGDTHPTAVRIRAVRDLEASGAEVMVVEGDVTDGARMAEVVAEAKERFGAVHGLIHAAGTIDDDLLVTKNLAAMDDVLAPKVYGTLVLEDALAEEDLDLFAVFSSTSTVTAPIGQVDYVAANAFLNAFAQARRAHGHDHVIAVDWGVWNEVGMAVAAYSRPEEDHAPEPEPAAHPFFDEVSVDRHGVVRVTARWGVDRWFLDHHRTASGEALIPGTGYFELTRAALAEVGVSQPYQVRDLTFLRPLAVADTDELDVEVVLTPNEEGYGFEVWERVTVEEQTSEGDTAATRTGRRKVAVAALFLYEQPDPPVVDLAAAEAACPVREGLRSPQQDHLRFGPRWDVVRRVQRGESSAMAWLRLPETFLGDLEHVGLHPAMIDLGTGFAMGLIDGYKGDRLWIPVSYDRVSVFGPLPGDVVALATARRSSSEDRGFATFDVSICAPDGSVVMEVVGFTLKRLDGPLDTGLGRRVLATEVELDAPPAADRQLSPSELAFQHNLSQGIVPEEGRRAFARVLESRDQGVVYVTPVDLTALRNQAEVTAAAQTRSGSGEAAAVFSRPELDSDYLAPRNDLEEALVDLWQELLGINQIGVQDDFFDLGGHSLIAVRLFAKVKKLFSVDFPISVLFDAPTVEAIAELISKAMPELTDEGSEAREADEGGTSAAPRPRYRHLVAMHAGEGGPGTPFFLVAGMFGNVLNLRYLAHHIGPDRPFYGLQARGLYGGEDPHETFVDMARDYIEEIRTVQPHGPYLLGGFSGGGIAAFEMAQQLVAAGEEVGRLVFLDTATPHNPELQLRERLLIQRDKFADRGIAYVKDWAVNRARWQKEKRRMMHGDGSVAEEGALHSQDIEVAFYRALASYQTRHYPGTIDLYRPKLDPRHVFGPDRQINVDRRFIYHDNGWGEFCDHIHVTEVPGDHDNMVLEPNVRVLTAHIRESLTQVDRRESTSLRA